MSQPPYAEFPDLEVVDLRKQVKELESKLAQAQSILREHDLLDAKSHTSAEEEICIAQISKYKELSDKNIPFQLEDVKTFEILVKCLLAIRGKSIPTEKPKKKENPIDVARLLQIAAGSGE